MWHTILIAVHAVTATVALLAGCVAVSGPAVERGVGRGLAGGYLWSMVAMEVSLVLAIAAEWTALGASTRAVFGAFAVLGAVMVWRAAQAYRVRPRSRAELTKGYVAHVGFTVVALFDAFVVILVLSSGGPGWLMAAVGVLIAVAGHYALRALERHLLPDAAVNAPGRR